MRVNLFNLPIDRGRGKILRPIYQMSQKLDDVHHNSNPPNVPRTFIQFTINIRTLTKLANVDIT